MRYYVLFSRLQIDVFDNYFWNFRLEALIVASNWSAHYRHMVMLLQSVNIYYDETISETGLIDVHLRSSEYGT